MKQLLLIHGRAQENLDPATLKQSWLDALIAGLGKIGKSLPIPLTDVHFPYYGNTLVDLCDGLTPEKAAAVVYKGEVTNDSERLFAAQFILDIARGFGITDDQAAREEIPLDVTKKGVENWPVVLGFLRALDKVPGVNAEAVSLLTHDVFQYLRQAGVSLVINTGVTAALQDRKETVVVAHSLGSIVGYSILRTLAPSYRVTHFITVGCPLGVTPVKHALEPITRPNNLQGWWNARDPLDVVALRPLDDSIFAAQPIVNKNDVDNFTSNHHGIEGYLSDREVAGWIFDALL